MHFRNHALKSSYFHHIIVAREDDKNRILNDLEAWNEFLYSYENMAYAGLDDETAAAAKAEARKLFQVGKRQGLYAQLRRYSWEI